VFILFGANLQRKNSTGDAEVWEMGWLELRRLGRSRNPTFLPV